MSRGGVYLLTWTTYGTWLPGHERGFVSPVPHDRGGYVIHNDRYTPYDKDMPSLSHAAAARLRGERMALTPEHSRVVAGAMREVAERHALVIAAGAVMATHVHLVVRSANAEGAKLLNLLKGVTSRRLTERFGPPSGRWWTRSGSRRPLPTEESVCFAVDYVRRQKTPLVLFECRPDSRATRAQD